MRVDLFGWLAFFELSDRFKKLSGVDCDVAFMAVEIRNHVEQMLVYLLAIAASADKYGKKRFKRALLAVISWSLSVRVETPDFLSDKAIVEELYNKMAASGGADINLENRIDKCANYSQLSKAQGFDAVRINTMEIANGKRCLMSREFPEMSEIISRNRHGNFPSLVDLTGLLRLSHERVPHSVAFSFE